MCAVALLIRNTIQYNTLVYITFENSVRTSKRTPNCTITKVKWLMLFRVRTIQNPLIQNAALLTVMIAGKYKYH
jgi:hypothetical protein